MGVKALGAFSGGLDGVVSAMLLREQGIEIELVTFLSPFFSSDSGRKAADSLGMPWREVDFTGEIMELLRSPPSGFGKNCNPCIDCHAAMFRLLGKTAAEEGFDFIFSGEVVGQRPMSQNRNSLNRVARLSEYPKILLRPLSARLLTLTDPEKNGLIDREKLLDLSGRSRKAQIAFARKRGLTEYGSGGGCLLTEPNFCGRLRVLMDTPGFFTAENAWLITSGRMFVLSGTAVGLVGRWEDDNVRLAGLAGSRVTVELKEIPGPTGVLISTAPGKEEIQLLASLVALYGKVLHGEEAMVVTGNGEEFLTAPAEKAVAEELIVKF